MQQVLSSNVVTISYNDFLTFFQTKWKLGQHVSLVGPTGGGKSFISEDLLNMKKYSVVIATKAKDKTLDHYKGYTVISDWPPHYTQKHVILWKKPKHLGDFAPQQVLIYEAMSDIYLRGGYVIDFDDLYYVCKTLKLEQAIKMFYTQVRSQDVSILANLQRPSWVPLEALNQVTYLIMFKLHDIIDIERVAEGMSVDKKLLKELNNSLQEYEFLLLQIGKQPIHVQKRMN